MINGVEYSTGIHNNKKKSKQLAAEGLNVREKHTHIFEQERKREQGQMKMKDQVECELDMR